MKPIVGIGGTDVRERLEQDSVALPAFQAAGLQKHHGIRRGAQLGANLPPSGLRILVVEHSDSLRAVAVRTLSAGGYAVAEARHGEHALRVIAGIMILAGVALLAAGGLALVNRKEYADWRAAQGLAATTRLTATRPIAFWKRRALSRNS